MTDNAGSGATARELAEELREYTAMKYAGDCKCGKCQLVPRKLVERLYHTLNAIPDAAQARIRELEEAVIATHAAFENIPIGYPLKQNGQTIDHTLLNEAKRLCSNALTSNAPE